MESCINLALINSRRSANDQRIALSNLRSRFANVANFIMSCVNPSADSTEALLDTAAVDSEEVRDTSERGASAAFLIAFCGSREGTQESNSLVSPRVSTKAGCSIKFACAYSSTSYEGTL